MAARVAAARTLASRTNASASSSRLSHAFQTSRTFQSSRTLMEPVATTTTGAMPVRKPVGAFRGGIFGFLLGSVAAGTGLYYYVVDEYKVSNELLTEDIYALQNAVHRIESYVKTLEDKVQSRK